MNINEIALKSVAFVGIKKDGKDDGEFLPRATAFFVQWLDGQHKFDHLVTAEHVISGLLLKGHKIWLRVNLVDGDTADLPLDGNLFFYHPENESEPTDVAVTPFGPDVINNETGKKVRIDYTSMRLYGEPDKSFLPSQHTKDKILGLGCELAIVGLFRSHYGKNRNVPILRAGTIAAKPGEPIKTKYCGYIKAFLVEARSISGLSGSPVVAIPDSAVGLARLMAKQTTQAASLIGLMHGHFDVQNLNEDVVTDKDAPERSVHTGIGVVVPIEKIVETLCHPDLIAMRKKSIESQRKDGATADLADEGENVSTPQATDENPNHLKDFNSLLGAAARKQKPNGQT